MKEVTYEDWQKNSTPRMMLVWDYSSDKVRRVQRKVIYISKEDITYPVIALTDNETDTLKYRHCAELEKQRRMTNKELARWIREKPTREFKVNCNILTSHGYTERSQDEEVSKDILIREDNGEWIEPLIEEE